MKDYIYKRIVRAEERLNSELSSCIQYRKAKDIDCKAMREKVMEPLQIKSMPNRYKNQMAATFWFCWKREISNKFVWPVLFEGRLYSKWGNMPEGCKELLRKANTEESLKLRPYPVFAWHFTEGMDAE